MPRQKKSLTKNKPLDSYLAGYDSANLIGALETLQNSSAWELYKAYAANVQRRYEVDSLDMAGKTGKDKESAFASGYARCAEDMPTNFMEGLKKTILNINPVIEDARIEDSTL